MENNILEQLNKIEAKVDAVHKSAEKTRKYFLWTGIITLALFILPLLGLLFVAPSFINTYTQTLQDPTAGVLNQ